ncbi:tyrosine-type recombinase/integrase [Parasphingorhabdus cellanae]|uniref:Tyrosine-type recombinase/integrase n=1 Tax=Parasphingorhabdus cellanae TaxID=2806553 RepID=A0ABX7T9N1_9SPHN|nr:integrase arm-type DNA-binding domain-containing protein [Parasphingorhabdus cellanae]QTD57287.1 tyrosine-type recombinase/integrase [Parasphingorhabdus cellanae]
MGLTAVAIKAAKGRNKQYKLADADGLYLLVLPTGRRYWRMNYRFHGKFKTIAFGVWPEVKLSDARAKKDAARQCLANGIDPAEQQKLDRIAASVAAANTFRAVADEWIDKIAQEGRSPVTLKKNRWLLSFTYDVLGNRPITEITPHELLAVLHKVEKRGRHESAKRIRATCSQVFRYAIATARADRDVAADLKGALIVPKVTHRAAITTPSEAGALLRAIEGFEGHATTISALKLLPHVFVRPGELRYAEWGDFDLDRALWTIPPEKTKMRRAHTVPLSRQALDIINAIETNRDFSSFLFPSIRSTNRPMSENTINAALRRLGYSKDEMTGHGFRSMAATLLNEMGKWNPDAIERQLAHVDRNTVRSAYARGEYWDERVKMMQYWSDYLDQLRSGAEILTPKFGQK